MSGELARMIQTEMMENLEEIMVHLNQMTDDEFNYASAFYLDMLDAKLKCLNHMKRVIRQAKEERVSDESILRAINERYEVM